jgi:hypothetical protein
MLSRAELASAAAGRERLHAKRAAVTMAWLAVGLGAPARAAPAWEKLYEPIVEGATLGAVWADESGWFAGGDGVLVGGRDATARAQLSTKRNVTGFAGTDRVRLFALGFNELVLRFDGDRWIEEHFVADPPRGRRGRDLPELLQFATVLTVGVTPSTVAFGPWLVLLRHDDDGTWHHLPEVEREQALRLADDGPAFRRPAGCALASWSWVTPAQGMFSCHDGRAFAYRAGQLTPLGRLPGRRCRGVLDHPRLHRGTAYTICDGRLWRSTEGRWARLPGPERTRDFAVTDRCLYAVTPAAVWRRCER